MFGSAHKRRTRSSIVHSLCRPSLPVWNALISSGPARQESHTLRFSYWRRIQPVKATYSDAPTAIAVGPTARSAGQEWSTDQGYGLGLGMRAARRSAVMRLRTGKRSKRISAK